MAAEPLHITSLTDLESATTANKYLILDFTAQWCPPCKAIAPLFSKLAAAHTLPGALAFGKVDVDEAADVAARFAVTAMPTFLVLVDGEASGVAAPPSVAGGGVVRAESDGVDKVTMIRGADPRGLVGVVEDVAALAKEVKPAEAAAAAGEGEVS